MLSQFTSKVKEQDELIKCLKDENKSLKLKMRDF